MSSVWSNWMRSAASAFAPADGAPEGALGPAALHAIPSARAIAAIRRRTCIDASGTGLSKKGKAHSMYGRAFAPTRVAHGGQRGDNRSRPDHRGASWRAAIRLLHVHQRPGPREVLVAVL